MGRLEPLDARTLLNATVDVGPARASARNGPSVTVEMGFSPYEEGYATNFPRPYFRGVASSLDVRVEVYATRRGGMPILIGQTSPTDEAYAYWSPSPDDWGWSLNSDVALPDGLYTIQARAVEVSTGLAGRLTTMVGKLTVDTVGPRVVGVRLNPSLGQIVVTFRDFGGDRNAGTGLDMEAATWPRSYGFAPRTEESPFISSDPRWETTSVDAPRARRRGPHQIVVTINDGAPIPDGNYRFYVRSPGPNFYNPYFVHIPNYALGIADKLGNLLEGTPTSTIAALDSNDFATAIVVRRGAAFRVPGLRTSR